jgi:hypothetical protein
MLFDTPRTLRPVNAAPAIVKEVMSSFANRIIGAARLDPGTYEEVEADPRAAKQAVLVIVLSSVAGGLGSANPTIASVVVGTIAALIGWVAWAVLTYYIGTQWFPEAQTRADPGQLLRTTGFSASPGLIRVLGIIPGLSGPVFIVASVWMLVAMIIAVRQALDFSSTRRALGVCATAWVLSLIVAAVIGFVFARRVY